MPSYSPSRPGGPGRCSTVTATFRMRFPSSSGSESSAVATICSNASCATSITSPLCCVPTLICVTPTFRPTAADLAAARGATIPDLVGPGIRVLFAGINPSLYSAATGYHFARPGNRFWPALHRSGFTSRQLQPIEQPLLLQLGLGITNVVARATARADELAPEELRAGGQALVALAAELGVSWL